MDKVISNVSAGLAWLVSLDTTNIIVLVVGFFSLIFLLNWLWKRSLAPEEEQQEILPPYVIPTSPIYPSRANSSTNEDITKYTDVNYWAKAVMGREQVEFWKILYEAAPACHIFPQMAVATLIGIDSPDRSHLASVSKEVAFCVVDFVLCDENLNVLALIDIIDSNSLAEKKEKNRRKNFILSRAGYRYLQFDNAESNTPSKIKKTLFPDNNLEN